MTDIWANTDSCWAEGCIKPLGHDLDPEDVYHQSETPHDHPSYRGTDVRLWRA